LSFFVKDKRVKLGYTSVCKNCNYKEQKIYRVEHKQQKSIYDKMYRINNREKKRILSNNLRKNSINYNLSDKLRSRLNRTIKGNYRAGSAVRDLGCSIPKLKEYLEKQFQDGMAWNNWSLGGWHIDHIKPLASFDLTNRKQFLEACHYTNLQPLWSKENLTKGRKISV